MDEPWSVAAHGSKRTSWRAVLLLSLTGVVLLALDQGTKHLAVRALDPDEPVRLLGGSVYLTLTRNSGAAFSFGSDYTFVFPMVSLIVLTAIAVLSRGLRSTGWAIALGMVLGGVLGNLGDRLFRAPGPFVGHVVDMVSLFDPHGQVWPVFNVADAALLSGVALAVLLEFAGRLRDGSRVEGYLRTLSRRSETLHRDRQDSEPLAAGSVVPVRARHRP